MTYVALNIDGQFRKFFDKGGEVCRMSNFIGTFRKYSPMSNDKIYPNMLHHYRDEVLGWTKAELANRAQMSDKTVKSIERNGGGSSASRTRIRNAINSGLKSLGKDEILDDMLWADPATIEGISGEDDGE